MRFNFPGAIAFFVKPTLDGDGFAELVRFIGFIALVLESNYDFGGASQRG
jgi:hypothetical protein